MDDLITRLTAAAPDACDCGHMSEADTDAHKPTCRYRVIVEAAAQLRDAHDSIEKMSGMEDGAGNFVSGMWAFCRTLASIYEDEDLRQAAITEPEKILFSLVETVRNGLGMPELDHDTATKGAVVRRYILHDGDGSGGVQVAVGDSLDDMPPEARAKLREGLTAFLGEMKKRDS